MHSKTATGNLDTLDNQFFYSHESPLVSRSKLATCHTSILPSASEVIVIRLGLARHAQLGNKGGGQNVNKYLMLLDIILGQFKAASGQLSYRCSGRYHRSTVIPMSGCGRSARSKEEGKRESPTIG